VIALPETFNAATWFVDRNVEQGRGAKVAIECADERVTYSQLLERVNRAGNTLRDRFEVRIEERVVMLLLDGPEFIYTFFGAIKIGAVPIPTSTLWKPADYEYVLNDSRARVVVISEALLPQLEAIPRERLRYVRHIVDQFGELTTPRDGQRSPDLEAEPTSKDDPAFWLYSSGSTGFPKGCVHLQHDMVVCTELYAKGSSGMNAEDRCFSVAKLFFAYGSATRCIARSAVGRHASSGRVRPRRPTSSP
jgi:benzoate-CoA ligase